jgi:hypothetical protein
MGLRTKQLALLGEQRCVLPFSRDPSRHRLVLLRSVAGGGTRTFGAQDEIVQADLRPTQFSGADRWVGLTVRYRDEGNYHYVTLRSSGALDIRKCWSTAVYKHW